MTTPREVYLEILHLLEKQCMRTEAYRRIMLRTGEKSDTLLVEVVALLEDKHFQAEFREMFRPLYAQCGQDGDKWLELLKAFDPQGKKSN